MTLIRATARNNMRAMRKGDLAFFYHSNTKVPGIAGVLEIVQEHSVDGKPTLPQMFETSELFSTLTVLS